MSRITDYFVIVDTFHTIFVNQAFGQKSHY